MAQSPIGKGGKVDDTCCVVGEVIEWTNQHSEMWSKVQRQRHSSGSAFCGLGSSTASSLFHRIFGSGLLKCNSSNNNGSEFGSEYDGSDCGSDEEAGGFWDGFSNLLKPSSP